MATNMSNCLLCGAEYEVCKMCEKIKHYTPWRIECDSPRHWQIYATVKGFRKGILKADEAKEILVNLKVDVDEVKTFVPSVQTTLLPLYEEKVVPVEEIAESHDAAQETTTTEFSRTKKKSKK